MSDSSSESEDGMALFSSATRPRSGEGDGGGRGGGATTPARERNQGGDQGRENGAAAAEEPEPTQVERDVTRYSGFEAMGVKSWLVKSCAGMGIQRPTPVQCACIPPGLKGRDVVGCAQTGSGKTAAFAVPILHELSSDPFGIFALVVTPTRELAFQIADQFRALGAPIRLRVTVLVGGLPTLGQAQELQRCPHVVISTPGRLVDHLNGPTPPRLGALRFLVLDEADRLLEPGAFNDDVRFLLQRLPRARQVMLFSATLAPGLEQAHGLTLSRPYRFEAAPPGAAASTLVEEYLFVPAQVKLCYLVYALRERGPDAAARRREQLAEEGEAGLATSLFDDAATLVFVSTCYGAQLLTELLARLGLACVGLHSALTQRERLAALAKFRAGAVPLLVATDVAARGLDIPTVRLVVNYDLPRLPEDYVHRVGRTARAGRTGHALSLVTQYDVALVKTIEAFTGRELAEASGFDEDTVLQLLGKVAKGQREAKMALGRQGFEEKEEERKARRRRDRDASAATRRLRHGDLAREDGPGPEKEGGAAVAAGGGSRKRRRKPKGDRSPA